MTAASLQDEEGQVPNTLEIRRFVAGQSRYYLGELLLEGREIIPSLVIEASAIVQPGGDTACDPSIEHYHLDTRDFDISQVAGKRSLIMCVPQFSNSGDAVISHLKWTLRSSDTP
jgi:hypothetical protein